MVAGYGCTPPCLVPSSAAGVPRTAIDGDGQTRLFLFYFLFLFLIKFYLQRHYPRGCRAMLRDAVSLGVMLAHNRYREDDE